MSVTRINRFETKDGSADELHAFLKSIVPLITKSEGCVSSRVLRNQDAPNEVVVLEIWESVAAHQASVKNIPPESINVVMPMLAAQPSGAYYSE